jgi:single-stranded DNA-binding protein
MIRALNSGDLAADPQERISKTGKPFALARVSVPQGEDGRVFCSVICFDDAAVARLLQLRAGASVSVAGALKVGIWTAKDGSARPSLDLVADEVASSTPRPRKPKARPDQGAAPAGDPFDGMPGAGDVDWMGA